MVRKNFQKFASGTSIHGFSDLYHAKTRMSTFVWTIIVIGAFAVTSYQMYTTIGQFLQQPTNIVILPAEEGDILYPPLRMCYIHWLFWVDWDRALSSLNTTKDVLMFGLNYINVIYSSEKFDLTEAHGKFMRLMKENQFTTMSQFYEYIARDVPIKADNNLSSYFNKFEILYKDPNYLFCYTMSETQIFKYFADNVNESKEKIITFTTFDETYQNFRNYVTISEFNRYSRRWVEVKSMYKIEPGFEEENFTDFAPPILIYPNAYNKKSIDVFTENDVYTIYLQGSARTMKNKTRKPCVEGRASTQSNDTCLQRCLSIKFNSTCSCLSLDAAAMFADDRPHRLCQRGITFITNTGDHTSSFNFETYANQECPNNAKASAEYSKCMDNCIISCTLWTYDTSMSVIKMDSFVRKIGKKTTTNISVDYPFGSRIIIMTEVNAQTWENLIGSVGGLLGIWTGASILSFLQFFYLCFCADSDELGLRRFFQVQQKQKINIRK